jgi:hypothetical protein
MILLCREFELIGDDENKNRKATPKRHLERQNGLHQLTLW